MSKPVVVFSLLALAATVGGCKKQVAATTPAPAPAPAAAPTVTLNATPSSIQSGQTSTLSWSSTNATDLDIEPGVGKVSPQGSTPVTPGQSTTYTITATGSGGSATASAQVTVSAPAAAAAPPAAQPNLSDLFSQNVKDAFFDFDKSELRQDARDALTKDAEFLRSYPNARISIEGHCDERGSTEYNLGLGQRRAEAAKNFLISLGITSDRLTTVSWGKERPFCTEHSEECWAQNRRAHLVLVQSNGSGQ
ncbi:MAG: peptidoglycan-associated lipoprotein Pal [Acidobacteriota bacterium]|nr:peptidoglycan-associated lipoprotein Pal [Acidobacteriota bacterium]MDE3170224.1 peptidoglycan-associated lipoprotein Pal [Acidobacteriota bacterium]